MGWLFPSPSRRALGARRMFETRLRQLIGQDLIYTTDDLADSRHGFRVTSEIPLPKGPPMWGMFREPAVSPV
jgi:hypothetical protein